MCVAHCTSENVRPRPGLDVSLEQARPPPGTNPAKRLRADMRIDCLRARRWWGLAPVDGLYVRGARGEHDKLEEWRLGIGVRLRVAAFQIINLAGSLVVSDIYIFLHFGDPENSRRRDGIDPSVAVVSGDIGHRRGRQACRNVRVG